MAKLGPTGSSLLYATFLGGNAADIGYEVGLDPSGNAYVTGETRSSAATFPETAGALQTELAGLGFDAFVAKLNPTGTGLVYTTYLGGAGAAATWRPSWARPGTTSSSGRRNGI